MFWRKLPSHVRHRTLLYKIVYAHRAVFAAVALLFVSFLVQPIHAAYGASDEVAENTTLESTTNESPAESDFQEEIPVATQDQIETIASEPVETTDTDTTTVLAVDETIDEIIPKSVEATDTQERESETNVTPVSEPATSILAETDLTTADEESLNPDTPEEDVPAMVTEGSVSEGAQQASESGATPVDVNDSTSTEVVVPGDDTSITTPSPSEVDVSAGSVLGAVTEDEVEVETESQSKPESEASTLGEMAESVDTNVSSGEEELPGVSVAMVQTNDNYHQFSKESCVLVGGTTYHCTVDAGANTDQAAAVYAERSTTGVSEIFMRTTDGEVVQVTNNSYDDSAPVYDSSSGTIVWQRLIDGRQQIILYNVVTETEIQLTNTRTNNMEPNAGGGHVVWQWWDGTDWEIMLYDGIDTIQVTDNTTQDVGPVTEDGYVLWTVIGEDEQIAQVYDIVTGVIYAIDSHEGGTILNPRFVLVYDTRYENGDIITHGFDPLTGLSSPITSAAGTSDPVDIPDTDTTGETRALIQNKSAQREEFSEEEGVRTDPVIDDLDGLVIAEASSTTVATTSTAIETLDLSQASTSLSGQTSAAVDGDEITSSSTTEPFVLTDYDLIVVPPEVVVASGSASTQD